MKPTAKKAISLAILLGGALAGGIWAFARWKRAEVFVETDDAYVKGHVVTVATRIPAPLLTVEVVENQTVKAGQVIATLDPKDVDSNIEKADAKHSEAQSALVLNEAQIAQAQAQVQAVESQLALARTDKARYQALYERQSLPRQKYDQALTAEKVIQAQLLAAQKQVAATQGLLGVSRAKVGTAQAALDQARLQRTYCTVVAPCDGIVSRKMAEPGMVVAPGQPLLAIVPLGQSDVWVEANFKETQLAHVKPGQKVILRTDLDHDHAFTGQVESVAAGTGAVFSLLPAENATGNWVKVVQRLPVNIRLDKDSDPERKLRLGLSVSVEIDTRASLN
jgi:membrane fusion protein (multidrug efflux system)